jgi:glucokinase
LNPVYIGVEIGGTKLQLAPGTPSGEIGAVLQGRVAAEDGAAGILGWLKANLPRVLEQAERSGRRPAAIGCGFGGPIDSSSGRILKSNQIRGWDDFALKEWLEKEFGLPAVVANDSNAAAWGEYRRGSGRGTRHFFYTNIGSGIGGGLIIDGALYDGQGFGAGELGHTWVPDWTAPGPGATEKLENLCSGWAIEKRLRSTPDIPTSSLLREYCAGDTGRIDCRMLARAAGAGDPYALKELNQIGRTFGLALANVLCLFSPQRIAIGGGVSHMGELLFEPIRRSVREHEFVGNAGRYEIVPCELCDEIVLAGAVLLAQKSITA